MKTIQTRASRQEKLVRESRGGRRGGTRLRRGRTRLFKLALPPPLLSLLADCDACPGLLIPFSPSPNPPEPGAPVPRPRPGPLQVVINSNLLEAHTPSPTFSIHLPKDGMTTEWDKTCLVCGTKTRNRCSDCAKAGIDLFFCSHEHQKLVWKAHRLVCGPGKANPFMWPLLTEDESREVLAHMHESTADLGESTVAHAVETLIGVAPEQVRVRLSFPFLERAGPSGL
ncbi:hypothetical protein DMC30DRAFT_145490 [Rhodotorula diobovata]|uniref:MYND-type domain-containing protein n=1 Tax=Rhodotorula diobovata TaxID=5288 RepID=A0A5C5G292_9BASI|nr:hypothetical protein DMC30DRAFT_145490 [Rhodotorula diobovata]